MKKKFSIIPALLAVAMMTSCGVQTAPTAETSPTEIVSESVSETEQTEAAAPETEAETVTESETEAETEAEVRTGTRIITDQTGTEVEIPEEVHRVVVSSIFPVPSVFCLFRGSADEIVGMHPQAMSAAKNSFLINLYPEIANADTSFVENGEINVEQLLTLEPDMVIFSAANKDERALYESAGIPAVAFSPSIAGFDTVETYASWVQLLGQIYGEEDNANAIVEDARAIAEKVKAKSAEIPEEDKPSVLILFNYDESGIKAAGSGSFGEYWINAAGGVNAAAEIKGQTEVNMEQIYAWDPDIILITNFIQYTPDDLINNTVSEDWSGVSAVANGKVYKVPLGMYRWYPASSDAALSLEWVAKTIQPDVYADIDLDSDIKEYFKKHYDIELSDEDIQTIYNPSAAAAAKQ